MRSRIESDCVLQDTLVMGADFFESPDERAVLKERGGIPLGVGKGTTVKRAILDKNTRIGSGVSIINNCLLYTSPSPRDQRGSRMPSSA